MKIAVCIKQVPTRDSQPRLDDSKTWFDYYKAKTLPAGVEGVNTSKFEIPDDTKHYDNPFSIGAGVSLATMQGSGEPLADGRRRIDGSVLDEEDLEKVFRVLQSIRAA